MTDRRFALLALLFLTTVNVSATPAHAVTRLAITGPSTSVLQQGPSPDVMNVADRAPIGYRLLRGMAFDIDRLFSELLGLQPLECRFRDDTRGRTFEHDGLGPCLYRNFRAGMKTAGAPGLVHATLRLAKPPNVVIPVEITWRPAPGGLWDSFRRLLRIYRGKEMPPDFRKQALPGAVQVRFVEPIDPELLFGLSARLAFAGQEGKLERLEFTSAHDEATGREMLGQVHFFLEGATAPSYDLRYRTDINLLNTQAYFLEVEGQ